MWATPRITEELSIDAVMIDTSQSQAASLTERWYVVIVMCLVYAVNIADRYVVSTVLEPIRLELKLYRWWRRFSYRRSTGPVLRLLWHPHVLACRPSQPAKHTCRFSDCLVRIYRGVRAGP